MESPFGILRLNLIRIISSIFDIKIKINKILKVEFLIGYSKNTGLILLNDIGSILLPDISIGLLREEENTLDSYKVIDSIYKNNTIEYGWDTSRFNFYKRKKEENKMISLEKSRKESLELEISKQTIERVIDKVIEEEKYQKLKKIFFSIHDKDTAIREILKLPDVDQLETERYNLLIEYLVKNQYSTEIELSQKRKELLGAHYYRINSDTKYEIFNSNSWNSSLLNLILIIQIPVDQRIEEIEIYNEEIETKSTKEEDEEDFEIVEKEIKRKLGISPLISIEEDEEDFKIAEKEIKRKLGISSLISIKDLTTDIIEAKKEIELLKELLKQKSQAKKALLEAEKRLDLAYSMEEQLRKAQGGKLIKIHKNYYIGHIGIEHNYLDTIEIGNEVKVDELEAAIQSTLTAIEEKSKCEKELLLLTKKVGLSLERLRRPSSKISEIFIKLKAGLFQLNCKIKKAEEIAQDLKLLLYVFYKSLYINHDMYQEYQKAKSKLTILRKEQLVYEKFLSLLKERQLIYLKLPQQVEVLYNTYEKLESAYDNLYKIKTEIDQLEQGFKILE